VVEISPERLRDATAYAFDGLRRLVKPEGDEAQPTGFPVRPPGRETAQGEGTGAAGLPPKRRKRRRNVDPKVAERRAERDKQHRIDKEILEDWLGEKREDYQDYVDWKNENLPADWPNLDRRYVEKAIAREKARLKRLAWIPTGPSRPNKCGG